MLNSYSKVEMNLLALGMASHCDMIGLDTTPNSLSWGDRKDLEVRLSTQLSSSSQIHTCIYDLRAVWLYRRYVVRSQFVWLS